MDQKSDQTSRRAHKLARTQTEEELERLRELGKVKRALHRRKARKIEENLREKELVGPSVGAEPEKLLQEHFRRKVGRKGVKWAIGYEVFQSKAATDQKELEELRKMELVKKKAADRGMHSRAALMFRHHGATASPSNRKVSNVLVTSHAEAEPTQDPEMMSELIRQQSRALLANLLNIPSRNQRVLNRLTSVQMGDISDTELKKVRVAAEPLMDADDEVPGEFIDKELERVIEREKRQRRAELERISHLERVKEVLYTGEARKVSRALLQKARKGPITVSRPRGKKRRMKKRASWATFRKPKSAKSDRLSSTSDLNNSEQLYKRSIRSSGVPEPMDLETSRERKSKSAPASEFDEKEAEMWWRLHHLLDKDDRDEVNKSTDHLPHTDLPGDAPSRDVTPTEPQSVSEEIPKQGSLTKAMKRLKWHSAELVTKGKKYLPRGKKKAQIIAEHFDDDDVAMMDEDVVSPLEQRVDMPEAEAIILPPFPPPAASSAPEAMMALSYPGPKLQPGKTIEFRTPTPSDDVERDGAVHVSQEPVSEYPSAPAREYPPVPVPGTIPLTSQVTVTGSDSVGGTTLFAREISFRSQARQTASRDNCETEDQPEYGEEEDYKAGESPAEQEKKHIASHLDALPTPSIQDSGSVGAGLPDVGILKLETETIEAYERIEAAHSISECTVTVVSAQRISSSVSRQQESFEQLEEGLGNFDVEVPIPEAVQNSHHPTTEPLQVPLFSDDIASESDVTQEIDRDEINGSPPSSPVRKPISSRTTSFETEPSQSSSVPRFKRFFSSPHLSLIAATTDDSGQYSQSAHHSSAHAAHPFTPRGYYYEDNPFSAEFEDALSEQQRGAAEDEIPPHVLQDPGFQEYVAQLGRKPKRSDYISYKIAMIGDRIDRDYDSQLNQALESLLYELLKQSLSWESFSKASKRLLFQGRHIPDGIFMIPVFARRVLEFVPQLQDTITGYTQDVMEKYASHWLDSGGLGSLMEHYDQVEMDDEYDDWMDFMEEVCRAQEENTAVDVSMAMGYDLITPDPSRASLSLAMVLEVDQEKKGHTLPRTAAEPTVPHSLRRRRSSSFNEFNYMYFCTENQLYLAPSPHHLRRINSVEVLLSEDTDSAGDTPFLLRQTSQKYSDSFATDSPLFGEYPLHHSSSPVPIPGPLEHQKHNHNLESEGSSTPITPHIISVGPGTGCTRGISERVGIVRAVLEESRLGFDFPRERGRSHSRQTSVSSVSSIHIITADTLAAQPHPPSAGLGTQPHSSGQTTRVGISREQINDQVSDPDLRVRSSQQFSSDYLSVDLVSPVNEQPLLQAISSNVASVAPILTHGLSVVIILFVKYIS